MIVLVRYIVTCSNIVTSIVIDSRYAATPATDVPPVEPSGSRVFDRPV